jgi:hypothetical protein
MNLEILYKQFKDNIWIHWGILNEEIKDYIIRNHHSYIIKRNGKYYMLDKEILGFMR